jgi:hypothetical protein
VNVCMACTKVRRDGLFAVLYPQLDVLPAGIGDIASLLPSLVITVFRRTADRRPSFPFVSHKPTFHISFDRFNLIGGTQKHGPTRSNGIS